MLYSSLSINKTIKEVDVGETCTTRVEDEKFLQKFSR